MNGGLLSALSGGANLIAYVLELQPHGISHAMTFEADRLWDAL